MYVRTYVRIYVRMYVRMYVFMYFYLFSYLLHAPLLRAILHTFGNIYLNIIECNKTVYSMWNRSRDERMLLWLMSSAALLFTCVYGWVLPLGLECGGCIK